MLVFIAGPPLFVPNDASNLVIEQARREVERALNAVSSKAYEIAGAESFRAGRVREELFAVPLSVEAAATGAPERPNLKIRLHPSPKRHDSTSQIR
jgi:hypothetical protein